MNSNWGDFKFKPIPMGTPEQPAPSPAPSPAPTTGGTSFSDYMAYNRQQHGPSGVFASLLGAFGKMDNPQSRRDQMSGFQRWQLDQKGPMLDSIIGAPQAPPAAPSAPVAMSQADRIKELTSYLTNKKLGT